MKDCGCDFNKMSKDDGYTVCTKSVCEIHVEGCKYADIHLEKGEIIYKSGVAIAKITSSISAGDWISSDNTIPIRYENRNIEGSASKNDFTDETSMSFLGYKNPFGGVATRKKILIIGAVSCVNQTVNRLVKYLDRKQLDLGDIEILPLKHGSGCGHVANGVDVETLRRLIDGHIDNPNCFGAIIIGLGCEDIQYNINHKDNKKIIYSTNRQEFKTEENEFCVIYNLICERVDQVRFIEREIIDVRHLVIGLQCGGSDGLSGITANPLLGSLSDIICERDGTAILSETPELSGCREWCIDRTVASAQGKFREIFQYWDRECTDHEENPAPGNLKGGILNIFEKSVGSVLKGGVGPFKDVISYGDPVRKSGLIFMDSPGYDPCSITGQVSAGANIIVFTTGRGSNYDNGLVPVFKIASNRSLYEKGTEYIDFDSSDFVSKSKRKTIINKIMRRLMKICSGEQLSKSELLGAEEVSFVPWQRGTTV